MTIDHLVRSLLALVERFFHWWGAELAACVPARLRLDHPWARKDLVLLLGPREAVLGHDRSDGTFEVVERLALAGRAAARSLTPVRLRLAADQALRMAIPLPQAALENLDEAVLFQLDRYTPFLPEQVYLGCAAGERPAGSDPVQVAATIVERRIAEDAVETAQRLGFTVSAIEIARGDPRERSVDTLAVPELRGRSWRQLAVTAAAWALLLALGAAAAGLPFAREDERAAALRQQLAAVRIKAEAAQRVEKDIATQKQEANFLVDRKRDRSSALAILDALTRLAPDDTYLASATFTGTEVQIAGLSSSASGLLGRIEQSELFRKAEFRSPVTPDPQSGREHFVISAQVAHGDTP
jgi:general secretion pathway protein L